MNNQLITPDMYDNYEDVDYFEEQEDYTEEDFTCEYCGEFEIQCECDDWADMKNTRGYFME